MKHWSNFILIIDERKPLPLIRKIKGVVFESVKQIPKKLLIECMYHGLTGKKLKDDWTDRS